MRVVTDIIISDGILGASFRIRMLKRNRAEEQC